MMLVVSRTRLSFAKILSSIGVGLAVLHDQLQPVPVFKYANVGQWIAVDDENIGQPSCLERADVVAPAATDEAPAVAEPETEDDIPF